METDTGQTTQPAAGQPVEPPAQPLANDSPSISAKAKAILEGGIQEFLSHGYAATSMDKVAKAAKVSKATVYSHFQDKEGLFNALIQRLVAGRFRTIFQDSDLPAMQDDPRAILTGLANRILDTGIEDPRFLSFMRVIIGESGRFPQLAKAFVTHIEQTSFRQLCRYFTSSSQLKLKDPEATARIFVGSLVHFVIVQEILHGREVLPMERDRLVNTLVNLVIQE